MTRASLSGRSRATRLRASWHPPTEANPGATITLTYAGQEYRRVVGPEDWVTQREAALLVGLSVMAVNKNVRAGKLHATVRGGVSVIQLGELARFARARGLVPDAGRPLVWLGRLVSRLAPPLVGVDEQSAWQTLTLQERERARRPPRRRRRATRRSRRP